MPHPTSCSHRAIYVIPTPQDRSSRRDIAVRDDPALRFYRQTFKAGPDSHCRLLHAAHGHKPAPRPERGSSRLGCRGGWRGVNGSRSSLAVGSRLALASPLVVSTGCIAHASESPPRAIESPPEALRKKPWESCWPVRLRSDGGRARGVPPCRTLPSPPSPTRWLRQAEEKARDRNCRGRTRG